MLSQNALYTYSCCIIRNTDLSHPHNAAGTGFGTFPITNGVVAKASQGQFPPPFLISMYKNGYKDRGKNIFPTK